MIACACKEIIMGKQSSLGPIDPQIGSMPAQGVLMEFDRAHKEVLRDPSKIPLWQVVIAKYWPTLIGECDNAIKWTEEMVTEWLQSGMLKGDNNSSKTARYIYEQLVDPAKNKSHSRHLSFNNCKQIGLKVKPLEEDNELQDRILSVHHSCMLTFYKTNAIKIIENHNGSAFIKVEQKMVIPR